MSHDVLEYLIQAVIVAVVGIGFKEVMAKVHAVHILVNSAATEQARVISELRDQLRSQGETLLAERIAAASSTAAITIAAAATPPPAASDEPHG